MDATTTNLIRAKCAFPLAALQLISCFVAARAHKLDAGVIDP